MWSTQDYRWNYQKLFQRSEIPILKLYSAREQYWDEEEESSQLQSMVSRSNAIRAICTGRWYEMTVSSALK